MEDAREAVARLARCDPRDVVFTSGGTEANNLALRVGVRAASAAGGTLVTSRLEHPSVARVAEALEREGRARVRWVRVLADGRLDLDDLERALSEGGVRLVAVQAVNAETGVVQPVAEVIAMARRAGARVHVDAVQAFGRSRRRRRGRRHPEPRGAQAAGPEVDRRPPHATRRPPSRPCSSAAARSAACARARRTRSPPRGSRPRRAMRSRRPRDGEPLGPLRDALEAGLLRLAPGARVNGAAAPRMPHVANIAFPGWRGPELVAALDLEGLAVSAGSACSAGTAEPSAVLVAMGDPQAAASSVRFSLGEDTMTDDIDVALAAAARVLGRAGDPAVDLPGPREGDAGGLRRVD